MSVYITEEEQVEHIKHFLKRYGVWILCALVLASVSILGWQTWQNRQHAKQDNAATLYVQLVSSESNEDTAQAAQYAHDLLEKYPNTPYAALAAFTLARDAAIQNKWDVAQQQLQWVITHSKQVTLQQLARLRLARVLLAQVQYAPALAMLEQVKGNAYTPLREEIRGDILLAQGATDEARLAYRTALQFSNAETAGRLVLQMKERDLNSVNVQGDKS